MDMPSSLMDDDSKLMILFDELLEFIALYGEMSIHPIIKQIIRFPYLVLRRSNGAATEVATTPVIKEQIMCKPNPSVPSKFFLINDLL
jgi:hypothetical protein